MKIPSRKLLVLFKFLKNGFSRVTTVVDEYELIMPRWSQWVQFNFLKRFLGDGFEIHIREENYLLHELFGCEPISNENSDLQNMPKFEEVKLRVFTPEVRKESSSQRILKSSNSALNKGRTILLDKQRALSQDIKLGYYAIGDGSGDA